MNDLTTNLARARKQINYIDSRLARYPDHPAKEQMWEERAGHLATLETAGTPSPPPDRLLGRVETLVGAVRKIDTALDGNSKHPNKKRMLERREEYQVSLKNIQEYGREKLPKKREGAKIEVPTDVLEQRSK